MAIEIVEFPIKDGDFPVHYVSHYQRVPEMHLRQSVGIRVWANFVTVNSTASRFSGEMPGLNDTPFVLRNSSGYDQADLENRP